MPSTVTPQDKNSLSVTNQNKLGNAPTWSEMDMTWDEAIRTWDQESDIIVARQSKNTLTVTNESKN